MKASVLGIGTELVEGQIVNKNASWISAQLKKKGLQTTLHLVVPDDRPAIAESLEYCARHSEIVFVTGGLGPTSDDFTREVISSWSQLPLEFDENSWQHINQRLTSRGYIVKEIQRQQCFFPRGSEVLHNPEGTANAFTLETHGKKVFVLPGPPREIAAVWNQSIEAWLESTTAGLDPHITRKWDTMGVGESDVAQIVETVLQGVEVEKGYRVHLPYVEVKMSFFKSQEKDLLPYVDQVTEALRHCLIARDGDDVAQLFASALEQVDSLAVVDNVTGTFLCNRLWPELRHFMNRKQWSFSNQLREKHKAETVLLQFETLDGLSAKAIFEYHGVHSEEIFPSPYKTANMQERSQQYFAEKALIFWLRNLTGFSK